MYYKSVHEGHVWKELCSFFHFSWLLLFGLFCDFVCLCWPLCDYVGLCVTMWAFVWLCGLCVTMLAFLWPYWPLCDYMGLSVTMWPLCDYVGLSVTMLAFLWLYGPLCDYVGLCVTMWAFVWLCWPLCDYVAFLWLCGSFCDYVCLSVTLQGLQMITPWSWSKDQRGGSNTGSLYRCAMSVETLSKVFSFSTFHHNLFKTVASDNQAWKSHDHDQQWADLVMTWLF